MTAVTSPAEPAARRAAAPSPTARALAIVAIAGQLLFTIAWVVAGALESGYTHTEYAISALAARDADDAWIVTAGIVILGLSFLALAAALPKALPRRTATTVAVTGFAVAGAATVLAGLAPLDCYAPLDEACERQRAAGDLDWTHYAHEWAGLVSRIALFVTPFAVARALWARPAAALALGAGLFGIGMTVLDILIWWVLGAGEEIGGAWQRYGFLTIHVWVIAIAIGVLHETRRPPAYPATATPLPPREFFGDGTWQGEGDVVLWPAFIWRRFPLRFTARREATWIDDTTWTFDDEAVFANGWTERRRRFCQLETPARVRVTTGDLPDGGEILLDDDGYRLAPFTLLIPVGPVKLPLRCRESGRIEDGVFVERLDLRFLGLPAGRVTIRVARAD